MKDCGFFFCKLFGSCINESEDCNIGGCPCKVVQGNICLNCRRLNVCRDGKESLKNGKHGRAYR